MISESANCRYSDRIVQGDCRDHIPRLADESVHLLLSDIPYGINAAEWDVLHSNTNSALLGSSPAQKGKTAFARRGKPINGWSEKDRNAGAEYQQWVRSWSDMMFTKMLPGASVLIFAGRRTCHHAAAALEGSGFLMKDILAWKKPSAFHRAQRLSAIYERRGSVGEAERWEGWRVGNLAPVWEPVLWLFKPYKLGSALADNISEHDVGGFNYSLFENANRTANNLLEFGFDENEKRLHETQKPVKLAEFLIEMLTLENQTVLDPFMGSGTTAVAAARTNRRYIGFEISSEYHRAANTRLKAEKIADSNL